MRYGNSETQNRKVVIPFANRKGITITTSELVRSVHEKVPSVCKLFNQYGQVQGGYYVYTFSHLKDLGVIRELRLEVTFGSKDDKGETKSSVSGGGGGGGDSSTAGDTRSESAAGKTNEDGAADKSFVEKNNNSSNDEERLSADTVKKVSASLSYEFSTKGGVFKVTSVFQKAYVLDVVSFTVSELQHVMKMGDTAFEPKGSHTSYGTSDLLKLVEALCLKSLLL